MSDASTTECKPKRLDVILFPNSKLYDISVHITDIDQSIKDLAAAMIETMHQLNGVGLSAIQVGRAVRLFVMRNGGEDLVLVNPVWYKPKDATKTISQEGCLSLPGVFEDVERLDSVNVCYQGLDGVIRENTPMTGVEAHVVQHEVEHLDGHLFIEHLPLHKRISIQTKTKQRMRLTARINKATRSGGKDVQGLIDAGLIKLPTRPGFRNGR